MLQHYDKMLAFNKQGSVKFNPKCCVDKLIMMCVRCAVEGNRKLIEPIVFQQRKTGNFG